MADDVPFAELLRRHRRAAGLTQEELAERAQLSARAISDLERGIKQTPQRATLALLIKALALPADAAASFQAAARRRVGGLSEPSETGAEAATTFRSIAGQLLPETRFASSGDVSIAYQTLGTGPLDLVLVPGSVSHLEHMWTWPSAAYFHQRLAALCRLILFDKRGTGMSDRVAGIPTLEQRMDDVRAVMDEAGSERAVLMGVSEGGPMSILFAATYPRRTAALILYGAFARNNWAPDYPWRDSKPTEQALPRLAEEIRATWGTQADADRMLQHFAPSYTEDEAFRRWFAGILRLGASPGAWLAMRRMNWETDVRHVLPAIRVPTLVVHRRGDRAITFGNGRYLADHIPGARLVELPGDDHLWFMGDADGVVDTIQRFVTGLEPAHEPDRVLTTILALAAGDGPTDSPALLQLSPAQQAVVRRELARFRGQEVRSVSGELLAAFDGPARAIRCACVLRYAVQTAGTPVRAGLHTGECEIVEGTLRGATVATAGRVAARALPGQVLASSTVKDLVAGTGLSFCEVGCLADAAGQSRPLFLVT